MNLNYESVYQYFLSSPFDIEPTLVCGEHALSVTFQAGGKRVSIIHRCIEELHCLPQFYLCQYQTYAPLAHVLPSELDGDYGWICVNQPDSVSINFERPELAFEESIKRHISLLERLIEDPAFNQAELLREFLPNWQVNTNKILESTIKHLFFSSSHCDFEQLTLYCPIANPNPIPSSYVALPISDGNASIATYFKKAERKEASALCFVIPLQDVNLSLPSTENELKKWLLDALNRVKGETKNLIKNRLSSQRSNDFWLILNLPTTPPDLVWFGVRLHKKGAKKTFPNTKDKIADWKVAPLSVKSFNKAQLMPRSGAQVALTDKRVLLVGCGSVGSELAHKLGAAGIGTLYLSDPDVFSPANIYRHTLDKYFLYQPKSIALACQLMEKYPWINTYPFIFRLLDTKKLSNLPSNTLSDTKENFLRECFDLIIVAIGSPTHERLFHSYLVESKIKVPVLYTWLEGYGVGGHAVLDLPQKSGCLRCAYVEPETGARGLASNLNFLAVDQNMVKNHAGCGEMFIPYGAVSSTQTAVMAADLGIRFLSGQITSSTKVSWKGESDDAEKEGLDFNPRFTSFQASLKKLPLHHPLCDMCNSDRFTRYQHDSIILNIPNPIIRQLSSYKQYQTHAPEAAGLLIGYTKDNGELYIHQITTPKASDSRSRTRFRLDSAAHQKELDRAFESSDRMLGYLGTWHTHPQPIPTPSNLDIVDWQTHHQENPKRTLAFIVVGLSKITAYAITKGHLVELKPVSLKEYSAV